MTVSRDVGDMWQPAVQLQHRGSVQLKRRRCKGLGAAACLVHSGNSEEPGAGGQEMALEAGLPTEAAGQVAWPPGLHVQERCNRSHGAV